MKPIILNNDYAVTKTLDGWHIYGYIHSEDIPLGCVKDKFAGSVTLNTDAAMILLDTICSELGGCDVLKDAYADINNATLRADAAESAAAENLARAEMATALLQTNIEQSNTEIATLRAEVARLREVAAGLAEAARWGIKWCHPPISPIKHFLTDEALVVYEQNVKLWEAEYRKHSDTLAAYDAAAKGGK